MEQTFCKFTSPLLEKIAPCTLWTVMTGVTIFTQGTCVPFQIQVKEELTDLTDLSKFQSMATF